MPATAVRRARALASDEHTHNDALIDHIESDSQLRFGFFAIANLPMFCGSRPIKTVRQGIGQLGRRKTTSLFWLMALSRFLKPEPLEDQSRFRLWRHSLLTGIVAQQLVRAAGIGAAGDALTAGVAHDIGHRLLAHCEPRLGIAPRQEYAQDEYAPEAGSRDEPDALIERDIFPAPEHDHCRAGAALLTFWGAPAELVSSALHHHTPESTLAEHRPLVVGVRMADLLAEHLELERPTQALRLEAAPAWRQLAIREPWNRVADLQRITIAQLPESLLTARRLAQAFGG